LFDSTGIEATEFISVGAGANSSCAVVYIDVLYTKIKFIESTNNKVYRRYPSSIKLEMV
jgi:hypothetical protein